MKRLEIILLLAIVSLALALRLYKINRPIGDWHSWRQADTAAVSRNFIKEEFNPFKPKYDDMSSQTNGLDNPNRYRFVEFPLYNILIASVWKVTGINETVARLITVFITLGSTVLLYLVVKYFSDITTAALAIFFFATIPYNVFYSSAILPAPFMVFCILALYLLFTRWLENEKSLIYISLCIIFASAAILTRPTAIFFFVPLVYLVFKKYGFNFVKKPGLWVFSIFTVLPFIAWRIYISRYPSGIPGIAFILNEGNIRFTGAFFRWLIVERLGTLILTVGGFSLFIIGLVKKPGTKEGFFYFSWLIAVILYFIVFASGNVRHDYYQISTVPILAIFMAIGTKALLIPKDTYFYGLTSRITAIALILFTFAFGYYEIRGYYWINKPQIITAGKAVDKLIPKNATVIAPYGGDTAFLYQTNRYGYPLVDRSLEKYVDEGTEYFVSVDLGDSLVNKLMNNCNILDKTSDYVILKLSKECARN